MWFKDFFLNILYGFCDALCTAFGAPYSSGIYGLIGFILIPCFLIGIFYWGKMISNVVYSIQSKKNRRK